MSGQGIAILIGLVLLAAFVVWRKFFRKKSADIETRVMRIKNRRKLPSGMFLWLEDGAKITGMEVTAIEAGMQECFERAGRAGYNHPVQLSDYCVAILGDCVKRNGTWCFKIPIGQYAGSQWDDGSGFMYAAGQFLDRPDFNIIVLPEYHGEDQATMARTAGYEVEHAILRACDRERYLATLTHTMETAHPLF